MQLFLSLNTGEYPNKRITVDAAGFKFGRGVENDLRTQVALTSRKHFEITEVEGKFFLQDVGSNTGSAVCLFEGATD